MVRGLIRSGHVDCLHSYGDLATTRQHAARALDDLDRHNCKLEVWVDHGTATTNFGSDIMQGHGDEPGHEAYHADLTIAWGIKYICRGRVTSITGQDVPARLGGILQIDHPAVSGRTLLKEVAKRGLARAGSAKYAMHGPNETLRSTALRDGRRVFEFIRCNPHWGGVSSSDQGRYVGDVLTAEMLNRLIQREGTCILYTHLGKIDDPNIPLNENAIEAFRRLAGMLRSGMILVTTTRRLLQYRRVIRQVTFSSIGDETGLRIDLDTRTSSSVVGDFSDTDLCGLTFYVSNPKTVDVTVNGRQVQDLVHNAPDHTGRPSVSIAWPPLEFPRI